MWLPALKENLKNLAGILDIPPGSNFVVSITSRWQQFPCYYKCSKWLRHYFIIEAGLFLGF